KGCCPRYMPAWMRSEAASAKPISSTVEYPMPFFSKCSRVKVSGRRSHRSRIIDECGCEAFEREARRGFSQGRLMQVHWQSVEETERERPRPARGSNGLAGIHE